MNELDYFKLFKDTRIYFSDNSIAKGVECQHDWNNLNKYIECKKCKLRQWPKWKKWEECSEEEKAFANLRELFPNEIILDFEDKNNKENITGMLKLDNISNYEIWDSGSRGLHFHIIFNDLIKYEEHLRNRIRFKFITKYGSDITKASESTLIARQNSPHFKTMKEKILLLENKDKEINTIPKYLINMVKEDLEKEKSFETAYEVKDELFKDYFEKDPFWLYISNSPNIIPLGTMRNNIIFPNLAIAAAKSGKNPEEIKNIITKMLKEKMPDIPWSVFNGWYQKALNGKIKTYNLFQINNWADTYTKQNEIYHIKTMENSLFKKEIKDNEKIDKQLEQIEEGLYNLQIYKDSELDDLKNTKIEWLVENWIAKGDICCVAGKSSSYKSTFTMYIAYCIVNNIPFLNKYNVNKSKVLYLNEENSNATLYSIINRIKKGLNIENQKSDSLFCSIIQNMSLDNEKIIAAIIKYVKDNNIEVIVLDSIRRFFSANENDATEVNRVFSILKKIRSETNTTIILLHHLKKPAMNNYNVDIRDMLRGSSDFVNSFDSILGLDRKHAQKGFKLTQIKSRAGEEKTGVIIKVIGNEQENSTGFEEIGNVSEEKEVKVSKPDMCSNEILKLLEDRKLMLFGKGDLGDINAKWAEDTIKKALRILKSEGIIRETGSGKAVRYMFSGKIDSNEPGEDGNSQSKL